MLKMEYVNNVKLNIVLYVKSKVIVVNVKVFNKFY